MNLTSYMPVRIISGENCVRSNADAFKSFGKKCLIATGKSSAKKSGALDDVTDVLKSLDIDFIVFDDDTSGFAIKDFFAGSLHGIEFFCLFSGGTPSVLAAETSGKNSGKNNCTKNK